MRIDVYSRHDVYQGSIAENELLSLVHTDELNGSDELAITTTYPLHEGERLVWKDRLGTAHEHVCQDPKGTQADGVTIYTDTALNSICETFGDYIEDKRPYSYSYSKALGVALEPTRWSVGTVDQSGAVSSGLTFYHTSSREAINDILECGGELETVIEVGGNGVTSRKVGIRSHRGESSTHRRFSYGKDITSIARTESYGAITACYGYGKGVETDSGGYGRKLTFGDINGGLNYVADKTALAKYGRPDGEGGFAHVFGTYENSDCEDASQLLSETKAYLAEHDEPGVTYEADVVDLVQFGRDWEGVAVGDDVQIVDTSFNPELRCEGRVTKLVTDVLGGSVTVTLGNITDSLASIFARQQQAVSSLSKRSSNWDVAANTPAAYLQQVIDGLNEQFNTAGMSYCYTSFEHGTIWSSVPLDADGNPTQAGGTAIQICSNGFRIASGTKADGSYNWRTFGTGDGFTADEITSGTINADLIKTGKIHVNDSDGNTLFDADMNDDTVELAGFTATKGSLHNGLSTRTGIIKGSYVGTDGIGSSDGTHNININNGEVRFITSAKYKDEDNYIYGMVGSGSDDYRGLHVHAKNRILLTAQGKASSDTAVYAQFGLVPSGGTGIYLSAPSLYVRNTASSSLGGIEQGFTGSVTAGNMAFIFVHGICTYVGRAS